MGAMQRLSAASMRVVAWATIGPAVVVSAYGPEIFSFTFGPAYHQAGGVLSVLIFVFPVHILSGHQRWILTAMGKTNLVFWSGFSGSLISVTVGSALIVFGGAFGGAIAILLATSTVWAVAIIFCNRQGGHVPIVSRVARPLALSVTLVLLAQLFDHQNWGVTILMIAVAYVALSMVIERQLLSDLQTLAYSKEEIAQKEAG